MNADNPDAGTPEKKQHRKTPIHVQQKILTALPSEPAKAPARAASGAISLSPAVAIALGAGLVAIGAAIGIMFFGP